MRYPHTATATLATVALTVTLWASFSGPARSDATPAASCPPAASIADGVVALDELADGMSATGCDLVGMEVAVSAGPNGATLTIPPPGEGIEMQGFTATNDTELEVLVGVTDSGDLAFNKADEALLSAVPSACDDAAGSQLAGGYLHGGETFYVKVSTFPAYLDQTNTRAAIEDGIRAWPQQFNDCGMADLVDVTVQDGGTSSVISAATDSGCESVGNDGTSVFAFGTLPSGLVGLTCRHIVYTPSGNYSDGGDVKLNDYDYRWTNDPNSASCTNQLDVASVAAHESGHWWGAGHVRANAHPKLTMRDGGISAVRCNAMLRTLGKGDVLLMRSLY